MTYAAGEITKSSTGVYYFDYTINAASTAQGYWMGVWTVTVTATSQVDISEEQFKVRSAVEKLYTSISIVKAGLMSIAKITMDDDVVRSTIRDAMSEVDQIVGRTFTNANDKTQWFNTNQDNCNNIVNQLFLSQLPVQSITSVKTYDTSKALVKEYEASEYWIDENGILELCTGEFVHQRRRVEVIYTFGYLSIPIKISKLCSVIAQIDILQNYMLNQDDQITSYTIEGVKTVGIGETWITAEKALAGLKKKKESLIREIGSLRNDFIVI